MGANFSGSPTEMCGIETFFKGKIFILNNILKYHYFKDIDSLDYQKSFSYFKKVIVELHEMSR